MVIASGHYSHTCGIMYKQKNFEMQASSSQQNWLWVTSFRWKSRMKIDFKVSPMVGSDFTESNVEHTQITRYQRHTTLEVFQYFSVIALALLTCWKLCFRPFAAMDFLGYLSGNQVDTTLISIYEGQQALCLKITATHCSAPDQGKGPSCTKVIASYIIPHSLRMTLTLHDS